MELSPECQRKDLGTMQIKAESQVCRQKYWGLMCKFDEGQGRAMRLETSSVYSMEGPSLE